MEVLFFKNFRSLNKNWDEFVKKRAFLLFDGFLGAFEANFNKNAFIVSKLEIPRINQSSTKSVQSLQYICRKSGFYHPVYSSQIVHRVYRGL